MQASMEWAGIARTFGLFTVTAVAELLGCYLPMLWLSNKGGAWLLLPAGISLLEEITDPDLRRKLLQTMWKIADADDWLADGEAVLLARAGTAWSSETNFREHATA